MDFVVRHMTWAAQAKYMSQFRYIYIHSFCRLSCPPVKPTSQACMKSIESRWVPNHSPSYPLEPSTVHHTQEVVQLRASTQNPEKGARCISRSIAIQKSLRMLSNVSDATTWLLVGSSMTLGTASWEDWSLGPWVKLPGTFDGARRVAINLALPVVKYLRPLNGVRDGPRTRAVPSPDSSKWQS